MKTNENEFNETAVETIKAQLNENLAKQKQDKELEKASLGTKLANIGTVGVLGSIVLTPVVLFALVMIYGQGNVPFSALWITLVPILSFLLMPISFLFVYPVDETLCDKETMLRKEMSEIVFGGEIVVGKVSTQWSEITIDRKTHMSKIMARFTGENNLDIETRALVLDEAA